LSECLASEEASPGSPMALSWALCFSQSSWAAGAPDLPDLT